MIKIIVAGLAGCALATLMGIAPASAQATRTWISGVGDDANPCSRTAPCKTWAGAISKTSNCGEIDALDPGGFGALTITKGITIDGGGGQVASVLVAGTNGFVINDTDPTCTRVIVRNLRFQGLGPGPSPGINGILILAGNVLLDHVDIQNFSTDCVNFQPSTALLLTIVDSDFVGCANAGIEISNTSASTGALANIFGSTFEMNGIGVSTKVSGWASIHNSMISGNTGGIQASGNNSGVQLDASMVSGNNSSNIYATNHGIVSIAADSVAWSNGSGLKFDTGGEIISFQNNWPIFNNTSQAPSNPAGPQ